MIEKFKLLVKNVGVLEAIKMIGGFDAFREIAENNPQFRPYLDELKGSCSVSLVNTPDAYFDFYIMDYDIMDGEFVELIVDMIVNFNNLSGEEIYQLKQWFGAVADDHGFEIYDIDLKIPTHQNLYIKSFNGRPYSWTGFDGLEISDDEAIELLDKTGLWEGMIRENDEMLSKDDGKSELSNQKQMLTKIWDKQGFANKDPMFMKLFHISGWKESYVETWVVEWNKKNNINPLKYFEEDGFKFHQLSPTNPHLFLSEDSRTVTITQDTVTGDIIIHRIDVSTQTESVGVWFEIIFDTITEPSFNGRTFDEMYDYDNMDEDDYDEIVNSYRDDLHWGLQNYIEKKYTRKMGYYLDLEW
jgi:hypothetical protein